MFERFTVQQGFLIKYLSMCIFGRGSIPIFSHSFWWKPTDKQLAWSQGLLKLAEVLHSPNMTLLLRRGMSPTLEMESLTFIHFYEGSSS
jgi:hypothetical protein